jgi:mannose-1-phosphate guanylyltransferase
MFMFTASRYLQELKLYGNDIFESCRAAYAQFEKGAEFQPIPEAHFSTCRSDSIDYAVMERTKTAAVIALEAGWSDLGAWDAVWDLQAKDKHRNVISGDVLTTETKGSYIQSGSRLVAAVGVQDTVIIETVDAILVACSICKANR